MKQKRTYNQPSLEIIVMDNDISLALESPWGDPATFSALDFSMETMPVETFSPGLIP